MAADRRPLFDQLKLYDKTPLPSSIPPVRELGATSAPLLSASFFIGARCRDYNDDYMQCKAEANGRGEIECLAEGRRVTRCARSVLNDLTAQCLKEFRSHWQCLDNQNHQLYQCREAEWKLNKCAFDKLGLEKVVPDQPPNRVPVHLRTKQVFADYSIGHVEPFPAPVPKNQQQQQQKAVAAASSTTATS
jgi:NADH dehydrogenase (ubiquinone) 1 alpha subcomplex subunit 8